MEFDANVVFLSRQVLEAKPAWQPGAMQGKYRIAPPAKLNGYQRSLVG